MNNNNDTINTGILKATNKSLREKVQHDTLFGLSGTPEAILNRKNWDDHIVKMKDAGLNLFDDVVPLPKEKQQN